MPIRIGQNQLANESSEVPGRTVWRVWCSRPQRLRGLSRALHQAISIPSQSLIINMLQLYDHRKVAKWENQWGNFPRSSPVSPDVFDVSLLRRKANIQVRESALSVIARPSKSQEAACLSFPFLKLYLAGVNSPFVLPHLSVSPYQTVEASQNFTIATTQIKSLDKGSLDAVLKF